MAFKICIRSVVFLFAFIITSGIATAQTGKDTTIPKATKPAFDPAALSAEIDSGHVDVVKQMLRQQYKDSVSNQSDTIVPILVKKIQSITELIAAANRVSEKGFDTAEISKKLTLTEELLNIIELNFVTRNTYQNLRALRSTKGVLVQSEAQLEVWQNILFGYADELAELKVKLAEVRVDPELKKLPKDSLLRDIYFEQIAGLMISWKKTDAGLNTSMLRLGVLENRLGASYLKTKNFLDKTNENLKKYIEDLWSPEEPALFKAKQSDYDASFREAYTGSMVRYGRLVDFFAEFKVGFLINILIAILLLYGWLMRTFNRWKKHNATLVQTQPHLVPKYPLLSATGMVLMFIAMFFVGLPPSWNSLLWTLVAIIFFIISRKGEKTKKLFRPEFLVIFLVFNNLSVLMKNSLGERWLHFVLDLFLTGYAFFIARQLFKKNIQHSFITKSVFSVFAIFSFGALITNGYGAFMVAKLLNNGAVYAVIAAIILTMFSEIFVRMILLHDEAYRENRFVSYFNLYTREQQIRKFLRVIVIIAWVTIMLQQFNLFDYLYDWIGSFLNTERKFASLSFTFGSIFVFVGVIWVSAMLSQILSIFFGGGATAGSAKKSWWGSTFILVRLGILLGGVLIAFLASGIPIDKLTIILGALGIGIGFGLQNIVNNLVSGVILAFERPVQVGDAIEVGNRYGTIKEIGIRASKLTTVEGSEVIVPNGDMLSEHVVNWTLSSNYRRVEIIVGVAYKTDLRQAENILKDIVSSQQGIETKPAPVVLAHNFSESSVDFRLLFWCHIDTWVNIKSEVLINIHNAFGQQGIEIPFPQQDIHIKDTETRFRSADNIAKEETEEEPWSIEHENDNEEA